MKAMEHLQRAYMLAGAEALEAAALDAHIRGDLGKEGGVEAWVYLRARAARLREDAEK